MGYVLETVKCYVKWEGKRIWNDKIDSETLHVKTDQKHRAIEKREKEQEHVKPREKRKLEIFPDRSSN